VGARKRGGGHETWTFLCSSPVSPCALAPFSCSPDPALYNMATPARQQHWTVEPEIDEDMNDVDLNLAIGNYGQNLYEQGAPPRRAAHVERDAG
jgi:hypothetical protein